MCSAVAAVKQAMDEQRALHSAFITDCIFMSLEPQQMSQVVAASQSHMVDFGYICKHGLLPRPPLNREHLSREFSTALT